MRRRLRERTAIASLAALIAVATAGCHDSPTDPGPRVYGILVGIGAPSPKHVFPGMTLNMFAQANDSNNVILPIASYAWSSPDTTIATVDQQGHVTAKRRGSVWIKASAGGAEGFFVLNVINPSEVYALDPDTSIMLPGQQRTLLVVENLIYNPVITTLAGAWTSSNDAVVRVDGNGVLTAVAPGRATISVPYEYYVPITLKSEVTVQAVGGPLRFQEVVKGSGYSCGRTSTETYCWGASRMLGTTIQADRCSYLQPFSSAHPPYNERRLSSCAMEPVRVETPAPFTVISAQSGTACGIVADGRAYCWGNTRDLTGDTAASRTPVLASATLRFASFNYPCGVTTAGEGWCWGDKMLRGTRDTLSTPSRVDGGATWRSITGGSAEALSPSSMDHRCGVTTTQQVLCWGANGSGQLGTGDTSRSIVPRPVLGDRQLASVRTDGRASCALTTDGELICWGEGILAPFSPNPALRFGSLTGFGYDSDFCATTRTEGQAYCGRGGSAFTALSVTMPFRDVTKGGAVWCGMGSDGFVYCWGGGSLGAYADLGVGDTQYHPLPTRVVGQ